MVRRTPVATDRAGRFLLCMFGLVLAVGTESQSATTTTQVSEPDVWTYESEGRRDPFVNLITRGDDLRPTRERPRGLAGLSVNEITLRGLVSIEGQHLAVFEAPDKKAYILRGGERLFDGSVKSVTQDGVVFLAEVSDPLSPVTEREVRRTLGRTERGR